MSTPDSIISPRAEPAASVGAPAPRMSHEEAVAAMRRTAAALEAILDGLPPQHLGTRPAPDEWSAAEILVHMVSVEDVLTARVESMLGSSAEPRPAGGPPAPSLPEGLGLVTRWRDARARTLDRLARLTADELGRGAELRRWGYVTVDEQVCEWAYHDLEHLRQLLAVEEALLYPAIGGYRALYAPPFPLGPAGAARS